MKKLIFQIFFLLALLTACGNNEAQPEATKDETAPISVTVNETSTTTEDKWDELQEGYELAVVNVTITNNTEESYEFNPNFVFIQHDGQREYESDKTPKDKETLSLYIMKPGESITGNICFDIPVGAEYDIYFDDFNTQMELPR